MFRRFFLHFLIFFTIVMCAVSCGNSESSEKPADTNPSGIASVQTNIEPDDDDDDDDDDDTAPSISPPEDWGPYGVGYTILDWVDTTRDDRPVRTLVYYPTNDEQILGDAYNEQMRAASMMDRVFVPALAAKELAAPALEDVPYPLLLFSHGGGSRKEQYKFLGEFLASHGFVIAIPDHFGNVGMEEYYPAFMDESVLRLFDMAFVLDQMEKAFADSTGILAGLGDASKVAQLGHSYGGNTSLALSGAGYSYDYIRTLCANDPEDPYICCIPEQEEVIEQALPLDRIVATVSLAHDGAQTYYGPNGVGAQTLALPILLMATENDTTCPYLDEAVPVYDHLIGPAYLVNHKGASHTAFSDIANTGPSDLTRVHDVIRRYVVSFLGYYLKGQTRYADYLTDSQAQSWNQGFDDFELYSKP